MLATSLMARKAIHVLSVVTSLALPTAATASSEPHLGELILVGNGYCPRGFAEANNQLLPINQNQALFALLGTTYGGNGQTTFALPDLRGRTPIGQGTGPGLSNYAQGFRGGATSFTLNTSQLPAHNHSVNATSLPADKSGPVDKFLANDANQFAKYSEILTPAIMAAGMVGAVGNNQPVNSRSPYLVMRWCIALQGIFPSQN